MKTKSITIRVTDLLYKQLQFKAVSSNRNISDYLRESIHKSDITFNNEKDISSVLANLNRIGNNLNQIAKTLNIANKRDNLKQIDYQNLEDELLLIRHAMSDILRSI